MKALKNLLQRWWRPLLFVAWIWALTGLLKNQRYTAFLRPEFGVVLGLGTFTLLGFLVTGMTASRPHRFGIPQALHALILLLPLMCLWNARGASLDAYAFQNRSLGLPSIDALAGGSFYGNRPASRGGTAPRDPEPYAPPAIPKPTSSREPATTIEQTEPAGIDKHSPPLPQRTTDPRPDRRAEKQTEPPIIPPDPDDLVVTEDPSEVGKPDQRGTLPPVRDPGPVERTAKEASESRNPQRAQPPPIARTSVEKKTRAQAAKKISQTKNANPAEAAKRVTIIDLYYAPRAYEGRRVKLIGMLHKNDAQVKKDFGKDLLIAFRFVITCCAADASPVAVLVDGKGLPDLPESSWVEAEGTFRLQEKNGQRVPILEKSTLKKTDTPKQPYLF